MTYARKIGVVKRATSWLTAVCGALALSCLVLSLSHLSAQAADVKSIEDRESYSVYSALLPDAAMYGMRRSMIVIQAETTVSAPLPSNGRLQGPC